MSAITLKLLADWHREQAEISRRDAGRTLVCDPDSRLRCLNKAWFHDEAVKACEQAAIDLERAKHPLIEVQPVAAEPKTSSPGR